MKPDKEPRTYRQTINLGDGVVVLRGQEYPAHTLVLETTVQEYRAGNGEVCHQEKLSTRIEVVEATVPGVETP